MAPTPRLPESEAWGLHIACVPLQDLLLEAEQGILKTKLSLGRVDLNPTKVWGRPGGEWTLYSQGWTLKQENKNSHAGHFGIIK